MCVYVHVYIEQTRNALDSQFIQLQPETLNWMPYMKEGQVMGQKLGEVDISNGPQHEDVLVLVRVFQLQGSSTEMGSTQMLVCVCVCEPNRTVTHSSSTPMKQPTFKLPAAVSTDLTALIP